MASSRLATRLYSAHNIASRAYCERHFLAQYESELCAGPSAAATTSKTLPARAERRGDCRFFATRRSGRTPFALTDQNEAANLSLGQESQQKLLFEDRAFSPSVATLDELKPNEKWIDHAGITRGGPIAPRKWQGLVDAVQNSFTVTQLQSMVRKSQISNSALKKQRRLLNVPHNTKLCLARALVIYRWGIEDPATLTFSQVSRTERVPQRSLAIPISNDALQLIFVFHQRLFRNQARQFRVNMQLARMDQEVNEKMEGDQPYGIILRGQQEALTPMMQWVRAFCDSLVYESLPLQDIVAIHTPPPAQEQVEAISRQAQALITVQGTPEHTITILAKDRQDVETARMLLTRNAFVQKQQEVRQAYSWNAPALPAEEETSVPTFAFVPQFSPQSPGDASSVDGQDVRFRLARQDVEPTVQKWTVTSFRESVHLHPVASSSRARVASSERKSDVDVFAALNEAIAVDRQGGRETFAPSSTTYSLRFGHLTFVRGSQEEETFADALLSPPLPGSWPLEYAMRWMRKEESAKSDSDQVVNASEDDNPSRQPIFTPSIPPMLYQLDLHSLSSLDDSRRHSILWQKLLMNAGGGPGITDYEKLEPKVDWNTRRDSEHVRLLYTSSDGKILRVEIARRDAEQTAGQGDDEGSAMPELHGIINPLETQESTKELLELDGEREVEHASIPTEDSHDVEGRSLPPMNDAESVAIADAGKVKQKPFESSKRASAPEQRKREWFVSHASWSQARDADIFVPESSFDMRVYAQHTETLDIDTLAANDRIKAFIKVLDERDATPVSDPSASTASSPPSNILLDGKSVSLFSASFVHHMSWRVYPQEASSWDASSERRLVYERERPSGSKDTVPHVGFDYIIRNDEDALARGAEAIVDKIAPQQSGEAEAGNGERRASSDEGDSSGGEKVFGPEPESVRAWKWFRESAIEVNQEPYRSIRGR